MYNKFEALKNHLKSLKKVAVAFSSGVDSTFLLKVAHDILKDNAIAITANSPLFPKRELKEAKEFCQKENIKYLIIEHNIDKISDNPENRCYICKKAMFESFLKSCSFKIIEGSNIDDTKEYRPGFKAIKELGIISPLMEAKLTKEEIRQLSKEMGLITFKKPSFACLASRFAYKEKITLNKLSMIEQAEDFLFKSGFKQFRVRIHNNIARIEIMPFEFEKLLSIKEEIIKTYKEIGFSYVTLDLSGYRTGSMDEIYKQNK